MSQPVSTNSALSCQEAIGSYSEGLSILHAALFVYEQVWADRHSSLVLYHEVRMLSTGLALDPRPLFRSCRLTNSVAAEWNTNTATSRSAKKKIGTWSFAKTVEPWVWDRNIRRAKKTTAEPLT